MRAIARRKTGVWLLAAVLLLGACASLLGPRDIALPLSRLEQSIDKKFPFHHRYLELFDITLSNPRLTLQSDTQRLQTLFDLRIAPVFLATPWQGQLAISGALKIDTARNAVLFTEPRLDKLAINTATASQNDKLTRLANLLADDLFNNLVVYSFKPDDLNAAGATWIPTKITMKANSLVVSFEPAKRP